MFGQGFRRIVAAARVGKRWVARKTRARAPSLKAEPKGVADEPLAAEPAPVPKLPKEPKSALRADRGA
jgi:hypothetical protein